MNEQDFQSMFDKSISGYSKQNLFGVSNIPAHQHTGIDSLPISYGNLIAKPIYNYTPPTSSASFGEIGDIAYDNTYLYVKLSATLWKRIALSSF